VASGIPNMFGLFRWEKETHSLKRILLEHNNSSVVTNGTIAPQQDLVAIGRSFVLFLCLCCYWSLFCVFIVCCNGFVCSVLYYIAVLYLFVLYLCCILLCCVLLYFVLCCNCIVLYCIVLYCSVFVLYLH
jgi:hypothetical protein